MHIVAISRKECGELLTRVSTGRLGCALDNQRYVVPVSLAYEDGYIYIFSTLGRQRMRDLVAETAGMPPFVSEEIHWPIPEGKAFDEEASG